MSTTEMFSSSPSFLCRLALSFLSFFLTPFLQPLTNLCEFHLKVVVISEAGVKVGNLLCRRLDLEDDHDVGEDNDACREDETEEKDGHDEALAGYRGLCKPPV